MGTEKRARQKAGRAERLQAEWETEKRQRRNRTLIRGGTIAVIIVVAVVLFSVLTGDDDPIVNADLPVTTAPDTTVTTTPVTTSAQSTDDAPAPSTPSSGECPAEDGSSAPQTQFESAQPLCIDPSEKYIAEISTTLGDFEVLIDPAADEITANNFISLARYHAYDGTIFHRVIDGFMVQGGDVAGLDGVGGPGYAFPGGSPETGEYRIGSIAMANSAGPSTNGSQFFIVTGDAGVGLAPNYSLFGHVTDGIEIPLAMQGVVTAAGDKPVEDVVINSITIRTASAEDVAAYTTAISG